MRPRIPFLVTILIAFQSVVAAGQPVANPDPARFAGEIDAFVAWDAKNTPAKDAVLFVGSSSIRLWTTTEAFPGLAVINRGFGGAHISDMLTFFRETVTPYAPKAIVFYCGDNDVADGKPAAQVVLDFGRFVARVRDAFADVPIVYIPIKPSIARWHLRDRMKNVNDAVAQMAEADKALFVADIVTPMLETGTPPSSLLFVADGLHLNADGYEIWNLVVGATLRGALAGR